MYVLCNYTITGVVSIWRRKTKIRTEATLKHGQTMSDLQDAADAASAEFVKTDQEQIFSVLVLKGVEIHKPIFWRINWMILLLISWISPTNKC